MFRHCLRALDVWLADPQRKPLILRGARQVGKTWLVRAFAEQHGRSLLELNFERDPTFRRAFSSNHPDKILGELSLLLNREIDPQTSLLFLDEIQAAGDLVAKLRWFAEELPGLPLVAAGSLLEFVLADHTWSMPVGRVTFRSLEPMSFPEFLRAHGQDRLLAALDMWRCGSSFSSIAHEQASAWFHRYSMVGGMPAIVTADVNGVSPRDLRRMQGDLVATYRGDFAKYSGRMERDILDHALLAVAASLGRKFVYAHAGAGVKSHQAKRALELLARAQICHLVRHTAANGSPLAAEAKDTFRKAILLDVGLLHALVGTPAAQAFPSWDALAPSLRGQLIDQLAGQQLRLTTDSFGGASLFYWQREGGRPGEIDYLVERHAQIVPVELKAGSTGAMKSLHQFMFDKRLTFAVRCDQNPPSLASIRVKTTLGNEVAYELLSLPHYLLWNLGAVLEDR